MNEEKRKTEQSSDREQFISYLEKASEVVRSWPGWKQAILGLPESRSKAISSRNCGETGEKSASEK